MLSMPLLSTIAVSKILESNVIVQLWAADLREHFICILVFVEEHGDICLVSPFPPQLSKLTVHGIHGEKLVSGSECW